MNVSDMGHKTEKMCLYLGSVSCTCDEEVIYIRVVDELLVRTSLVNMFMFTLNVATTRRLCVVLSPFVGLLFLLILASIYQQHIHLYVLLVL